MVMTCAHCGSDFTGRKRKYCSNHCLRRAGTIKQNEKRKREGYVHRKTVETLCAKCGAQFLGRGGTEPKYCSRTCSASVAVWCPKPPRPKATPTRRPCEWCAGLHTKAGKYCSMSCSTASARAAGELLRSPLRIAVDSKDHVTVISEIRLRSTITATGCWEWNGRSSGGYPLIRIGKRHVQVHRLALEAKHQAPLGSQAAHHMCANSRCVNPEHLQPVTHRDNVAEMLARRAYLSRIAELEHALRQLQPEHPLLGHVEVA